MPTKSPPLAELESNLELNGTIEPFTQTPFRRLPYNVESEKALLGAIFANNRAYELVSEYLLPGHFALTQHGRVFEACGKLIERGQIADYITLKRYFEQEKSLGEIGGSSYLDELITSAVTVINAQEYGLSLIHI